MNEKLESVQDFRLLHPAKAGFAMTFSFYLYSLSTISSRLSASCMKCTIILMIYKELWRSPGKDEGGRMKDENGNGSEITN